MHISSIKLRGFKSFRKSEIELPPDFICLAGPNGSGKTNVLDAVRFALGEKSLKSLRAKKVRDLICHNSKYAEVVLNFHDERKYELRRAIREDGKIRYLLNGKASTRGAIMELLKKYNLDSSGRNIIAQGEVQRIVNIGGRERRAIIDAVAGISEFEDKKKEALKELEIVEGRIRDANLVLGERTAFLSELEKEKERALEYSSSVEKVKRAKAALLSRELERAKAKREKLHESIREAKSSAESAQKELVKIDSEVKYEEGKKEKISAQISAKEERDKLFRELEKTKSAISSARQLLSDSAENSGKASSSIESLLKDISAEEGILERLGGEEGELRKRMAPLENFRVERRGDGAAAGLRKSIDSLEAERARIREQIISLRGEMGKSESIISEKRSFIEGEGEPGVPDGAHVEGEIESLRGKLSSIIGSQDALFAREKELNNENASLDRELLSLREKVATLRAQTSAGVMNPALQYIAELKSSSKVGGIHGTVAELMRFRPEHSKAIDAAGGSRLLYVVVDCADTAIKAISHLKKAGRGRATFIPLRELSARRPASGGSGGMGPLLDYISYDSGYAGAFNFVFGDTLLVEDAKSAKKLGVGTGRMVTLEGDLFEKSGIITGGKTRGGVASAAQLSKMEAELEAVKSRKSSLLGDLSQIREEMSSLRRDKVEAEIALKKKEVELDSVSEKAKEGRKKLGRIEDAKRAIGELEKALGLSASKLSSYEKKLAEADSGIAEVQKSLEEELGRESSMAQSLEEEREEKAREYSSLRAQADSKKREAEVRTEGLKDKRERLAALEAEKGRHESRKKKLESQIALMEDGLGKLEEKMGATDLAIRKLMEKMKEFEAKLVEFGKRRAAIQIEASKHDKALTVAEVELGNIDTRIADLSAESEEFAGVEPLEGKREELLEIMKASESSISSLGAVNLAAPEMYDEKAKEVADMKEKIEKLRVEKEAVIDMIGGIEEKKKEAFFESFHAVDKKFRELFTLINIGEGHLYLDKPSTPFESGMYIKVRRNNREHSLESLSGGEKSLIALMFVFALQFYKPSPFYVLDEVDAPLDKVNTKNLAKLLRELAPKSQFLVVSHNDIMMGMASAVLGVSRVDGVSKIVGVKLDKGGAAAQGAPDAGAGAPVSASAA